MISREESLKLLDKYQDEDVADIKTIKQFINTIYDSLAPQIDQRFHQAIKDGTCTLAVLNEPCMLGVYELYGFSIEISYCEKIQCREYQGYLYKNDVIEFVDLGFNASQEAYDYYKEYLTSDVGYLVSFIKIEE